MKLLRTLLVLTALVSLFAISTGGVSATKPVPEHKVGLCHRTAAADAVNPYVYIEVDEAAVDTHLGNGQGHPAKTNDDGSPRNDYLADGPEDCVPATPTEEPTPTATPTEDPTPTATPTEEPTPTATPTEEPTPTATPTDEPTATPTEQPTATPTEAPSETPSPTDEPTATPTLPPTDTVSGPPASGPSTLPWVVLILAALSLGATLLLPAKVFTKP